MIKYSIGKDYLALIITTKHFFVEDMDNYLEEQYIENLSNGK